MDAARRARYLSRNPHDVNSGDIHRMLVEAGLEPDEIARDEERRGRDGYSSFTLFAWIMKYDAHTLCEVIAERISEHEAMAHISDAPFPRSTRSPRSPPVTTSRCRCVPTATSVAAVRAAPPRLGRFRPPHPLGQHPGSLRPRRLDHGERSLRRPRRRAGHPRTARRDVRGAPRPGAPHRRASVRPPSGLTKRLANPHRKSSPHTTSAGHRSPHRWPVGHFAPGSGLVTWAGGSPLAQCLVGSPWGSASRVSFEMATAATSAPNNSAGPWPPPSPARNPHRRRPGRRSPRRRCPPRREPGDGDEAGGPGDRVVDARGQPGVLVRGGRQRGRGQRRDHDGQPEAEDDARPAARHRRTTRRGRCGA